MPRRNQPRTIGADAAIREKVAGWLEAEERSHGWLATKMTEVGCPIDRSAVWRTLTKDREINVNEAVAISIVMGVSVEVLLGLTPETDAL